jgi:hypothetical protein
MDQHRDEELLSHFWSLHNAIIKRDGLEERMRSGAQDEDLFNRSLVAAEGVLQARAGLYRHLMQSGWTPPPTVVRDVVYDEIVLSQPDSTLPG